MLRTERLLLRCATDADLDDMFAFFSDPHVMRYWSSPPHADPSVTQERLDNMKRRFETSPHYFCLEHQGRIIGCAGMVPPNEIGFILHRNYQRQGFISEALGAILPHIWATTDLPDLIADVDPRNDASIGLLTSFGFYETHRAQNTIQISDSWVDSVYFRLRRRDSKHL